MLDQCRPRTVAILTRSRDEYNITGVGDEEGRFAIIIHDIERGCRRGRLVSLAARCAMAPQLEPLVLKLRHSTSCDQKANDFSVTETWLCRGAIHHRYPYVG